MTPFTLNAVLVYFQMNQGLLLYLKLDKVYVGNVSKKGKTMKGFTHERSVTFLFPALCFKIYCVLIVIH